MPDLVNTTDHAIRTVMGFTIPARGRLSITEEDYLRLRKEAFADAEIRRGHLLVEPRSEEAPEIPALTRRAIASMRKAELIEILQAHGIEDDLSGSTVDALREIAARVIFADL